MSPPHRSSPLGNRSCYRPPMLTESARRLRAWARSRPAVAIGLVGALALIAGASTYLAIINPPYQQDESSHVGYTVSLRQGNLPTVTTPVPTSGGGEELRKALNRPYPFSDPDIHVANNPPFPYLAALPLAEISDGIGLRGGSLFGVRLMDLAGAVGGIGFAFLLGRELGGDDDFVGLATAGMLAGVIAISLVSSLANVDGPAFLATTAVTWATARLARTRTTSHATQLGLWCAAAAAVRPMALAFAAVAGLMGLLLCVRSHGWRSLLPYAVRIGAPTVVLTGWFYALNVYRYGDFTGSDALFEKYGTAAGPSLWDSLWSPGSLVQPLHYLVTQVYGRNPWWDRTGPDKWAITLVSIGAVLAALLLAFRARRSPTAPRRGRVPHPTAWVTAAVLLVVPVALLVQHVSGGGAGHPRYLMPMLPIIAAAAAMVSSRVNRYLAVGLVAVFVIAELARIRAAGRLRLDPDGLFGPVLNTPLGGEVFRQASLAVAFGGALLLVVGTAWAARSR